MAAPTWSSPSTRARRAPGRSCSTAPGPWCRVAQREFEQRYPSPGDVRHDPEAIWDAQLATAREAIAAAGGVDRIAAIGVTNQRETDGRLGPRDRARRSPTRSSGRAGSPRRSASALRAAGHEALVRERTGLPLDAYFTGPKIRQILVEDPALRSRAERGELAAGTGRVLPDLAAHRRPGPRHGRLERVADAPARHPERRLGRRAARADGGPGVAPARGPQLAEVYGDDRPGSLRPGDPDRGRGRRPAGGDLRPGLLRAGRGQGHAGDGRFLLVNTGEPSSAPANGLLSTIAWRLGPDAPIVHALEGSVFVTGAAVQWLRDGLGLFASSAEVEAARRLGRRQRRGRRRARVRRARRAVLGSGRARRDPRPDARERRRPARPGDARVDRVPGPRRRRGDGRGSRPAADRAPDRRRRRRRSRLRRWSPTRSRARSIGRSCARRPPSAPRRWPVSRSGCGPIRREIAASGGSSGASSRASRRPSEPRRTGPGSAGVERARGWAAAD